MKNSEVVGTFFLKQLDALRKEFDIVGDVRGKGLMIGLEMVTDKVNIFFNFFYLKLIIFIQK